MLNRMHNVAVRPDMETLLYLACSCTTPEEMQETLNELDKAEYR